MPKHGLCSLSSIAFTVQKLENRAFVIVSILSRLADALVRVGISRFCLMCRRRAPSLATLARWRRFVRLYTVYEEALSEFTLSSQVLKFFAGRRRSAAAARRQNVERAPGWRGGHSRGPARIGAGGGQEAAGSEPGSGNSPGDARAESSHANEPPGPRARHRSRCTEAVVPCWWLFRGLRLRASTCTCMWALLVQAVCLGVLRVPAVRFRLPFMWTGDVVLSQLRCPAGSHDRALREGSLPGIFRQCELRLRTAPVRRADFSDECTR